MPVFEERNVIGRGCSCYIRQVVEEGMIDDSPTAASHFFEFGHGMGLLMG